LDRNIVSKLTFSFLFRQLPKMRWSVTRIWRERHLCVSEGLRVSWHWNGSVTEPLLYNQRLSAWCLSSREHVLSNKPLQLLFLSSFRWMNWGYKVKVSLYTPWGF